MAAGGSNVRLSLVGLTGTTAEIMYTIDTSGRYEDGYLIVFNENNTEVSRTSSFRAYGNSSGSQNVTGIASGHLYTVKFYSSDLGVYSESTVEIDLRSGTPAYAMSSSSTATSVNIVVSPISSATMGTDGTVIVESVSDGIKDSIGYKSSDSSASITLVGLDQNTEYTFSVTYYDPGLASSVTNTITVSTAELDDKQAPKLYGGVSGDAEEITKLYGSVSGDSTKITKLYGGSDDYMFNNLQLKGNTTQQTYSGAQLLAENGMDTPTSDTTYWKTFNNATKTSLGNGWGRIKGTQSSLTNANMFIDRVVGTPLLQASTLYTVIVEVKDIVGIPTLRLCQPINAGDTWSTFSYNDIIHEETIHTNDSSTLGWDSLAEGYYVVKLTTKSTLATYGIRMWSKINTASEVSFRISIIEGDHSSDWKNYCDDNWQPYVGGVASPNPDYPQTVNIVTGEQTVTISDGDSQSATYPVNLGKNLLDMSTLSNGYVNWIGEFDSTHTKDEMYSGFIKVKPNTTYTFSIQSTTSTYQAWFGVGEYTTNAMSGFIKRDVNTDTSATSITLTTSATTQYIVVSARNMAGATEAQVELGSTATSYAPYFTPIELCKIGTYQDKIYKSSGNWYVRKEVGKYSLDGQESFGRLAFNGVSGWHYYYTDEIDDVVKTGTSSAFSNNFTTVASIVSGEQLRPGLFHDNPSLPVGSYMSISKYNASNTNILRFSMPDSVISDANAFKTWLSTHNTTVYYALETPTNTQITDANLIAQLEAIRKGAYGDDTQITVSGNLPAIVAYDSIDETAKLIHISRPNKKVYGSITYYTDSNHTMTDIEFIYDQTDVSKLVGNGQLTWSATINGKTINNLDIKEVDISGCTSLTTTPVNFLQYCRNLDSISIPSSLISIGSGFLSYCTSFNQQIILHTGISSIGDAFLFCCEAFNQPIVFPNTLTSIGVTFLGGCVAFNQDLTIPSSVITIGQNFMAICDSMIKTITCNAPSPRVGSSENINLSGSSVNAQCYVSGIKLSGPYASSWHSENPDSSSGPYYRKTIVV